MAMQAGVSTMPDDMEALKAALAAARIKVAAAKAWAMVARTDRRHFLLSRTLDHPLRGALKKLQMDERVGEEMRLSASECARRIGLSIRHSTSTGGMV
jgi:hypothetical protein